MFQSVGFCLLFALCGVTAMHFHPPPSPPTTAATSAFTEAAPTSENMVANSKGASKKITKPGK